MCYNNNESSSKKRKSGLVPDLRFFLQDYMCVSENLYRNSGERENIMDSNVNENICPCCGRHCSVDNLSYRRGLEYFGRTESGSRAHHMRQHAHDSGDMAADDKVISLLRRCGHHLRHNAGNTGSEQLLAVLSEEEKETLIVLLKKCLQSWQ